MADIKRSYVAVVVLSLTLGKEVLDEKIKKLSELIEANAVLDKTDDWGNCKFAYQINKESEGRYLFFYFTSGPEFVAEFERICRISDGVLRSLVVKKDN